MIRSILIILCIFLGDQSFAQQVLWEKVYDFGPRRSFADKIVQLEDSSYMVISRIGKFGYRNSSANIIYALCLIHLAPNGDTLFVRPLYGSSSGTNNTLTRTPDSKLLIGVTIFEDTVFNAKMRILKCDYSGNIEWMYNYIGTEWQNGWVSKVIPDHTGGCYAIGSVKSIVPGFFYDMFLTHLDAFGQLDWTYRYFKTSTTTGQNIEEMADGNYLLSGGADSTMWSVAVDSAGGQLSDFTFASMPGGLGLSGAEIKQGHAAKSYYGVGTTFNPRLNIINRFDSSKNKVWQKITNYLGGPLHIGVDGSFVRNEGLVNGSSYLSKYRADSSLDWRITVGQAGNQIINNIAYDGLGSAVLSGYKTDETSGRDNVYFIKVSNVGYPVDPLSAKPKVETQKGKGPELVAYPNPCQQFFYLQGIKGKTNVALYNLQGALLQTYSIHPNDAIPAWKLQPGVYVWKAEDGNRVWSGKIIKDDGL